MNVQMNTKGRIIATLAPLLDRNDNASSMASYMLQKVARLDGGPGSGNHGHRGIPGQVGGSLPSGRFPRGSAERERQKQYVSNIMTNSEAYKVQSVVRGPNVMRLRMASGASEEEVDKLFPKDDGWFEKNPPSYDRYVTAQKILDSDSDYAKAVLMSSINAKEAFKALKEGNLSQKLEEHHSSYVEKKMDSMDSRYGGTPEWTEEWRSEKEEIQASDKEVHRLFGGSDTPAQDYYLAVEESQRDISLNDYCLQQAYVAGGFGTKAEIINRKLYSGSESDLTDAEKEICESVERTAIAIPKPMDFYRGVSPDWLKNQIGYNGDPASLSDLVGKETTIKSLSSATCGGVAYDWKDSDVVICIKAPKGTKATFPYNPQEGEAIFGRGLTLRIKSIEYGSKDFPVWWEGTTAMNCAAFPLDETRRDAKKRIHVVAEVI